MVLNATFNDISDILWRSLLLVSEKGVTGENHQTATYRVHFAASDGFELTTLVLIGISPEECVTRPYCDS